MSMLAEKRRKTRYVINPTKKPLWITDNSGIKFGKELMEKMGWSAGKGLGANEQGIQEPLKVSYKNDSKGMGYKGNEENWIEYQDEFNALLNQLSSKTDNNIETNQKEKNEVMSLEEKSKHSKARVHYQKFTRGKDLSKYSENDLSCILGTSKTKKANKEVLVEEETSPVSNTYETSFGVTTINGGSIKDYFKKKRTLNSVKQSEFVEEQQFNEESNELVKKKLKKKHKDNTEEFAEQENRDEDNIYVENEGKKHKKKRKKSDLDEEVSSKKESDIKAEKNEECLLKMNSLPEEISKKNIENAFHSKKKKKRKRECEESKEAEPMGVELGQTEICINQKSKNKKSKKEKKSEETFENDYDEKNTEEKPKNEILVEDSIKKKKKKSKKGEAMPETDFICDTQASGSVREEELQYGAEVTAKEKSSKKKKKKSKNAEYQDENKTINEEKIEDLKNLSEEQLIKKKKKVENLEKETTNGDKYFMTETVIIKEEKKKKKKASAENNEEIMNENSLEMRSQAVEEESVKKKEEQRNKEPSGTEVAVEAAIIEKKEKEMKKSKKEKKEKMGDEKENGSEANMLNSENVKLKKKKNKRKAESLSEGTETSGPVVGSQDGTEKRENKRADEESELKNALVHTHKIELFRMKKPFLDNFKKCSPTKALNLICGAEIDSFKGSNLGNIPGYGCRKRIKNDKEK